MKNGLYIVHRLPGRIRFFLPQLYRCKETAEIINSVLPKVEGVHRVQANPVSGRVLVTFDEKIIAFEEIIYLLKRYKEWEIGRVEAATAVEKNTSETGQVKILSTDKVIEPEDLPIGRQLFNVALGGGVLALLTLKRYTLGKSRLAGSQGLFNLAAAATLVSGYPVLRSGVQHLARGRINHDLIMGALSLTTVLLRESIPGLLVIWLVNLTALLQTLVRAAAQRTLREVEGLSEPVPQLEVTASAGEYNSWSEQARCYGERVVPLSAGLAGVTGLVTGNFNRSLAMLLAASPAPAGLGASTVQTAALTGAAKQGIMIKDPVELEKMARVNCLLLPGSALRPQFEMGHVYPLSELPIEDIIALAAGLGGQNNLSWSQALWAAAQAREITVPEADGVSWSSSGVSGNIEGNSVVVGNQSFLQECGIRQHSVVWKARRLEHYGQEPLYVVQNHEIIGLIGIREYVPPEYRSDLRNLRTMGITHIITVDESISEDERLNLVRRLKSEGRIVAYAGRERADLSALNAADLALAYVGGDPWVMHRAGVLLTRENSGQILEFRRLAFKAEENFHRNLSLVRGLSLLGLGLGAAGRLSPVGATLFSNLISIITALNSLRFGLSFRKKRPKIILQDSPQVKTPAASPGSKAKVVYMPGSVPEDRAILAESWSNLGLNEIFQKLNTCERFGLAGPEAAYRLQRYGPNRLIEGKSPGLMARIVGQMRDFLVQALLGSSVICLLLGEIWDAVAIMTILVMNAILGALQEQQAEGALTALKQMTAPTAQVLRDGEVREIAAVELVPGDIVVLEQGDSIPADVRFISVNGIEVEESALTGESYPVPKQAEKLEDCLPLLDCNNLAFMGTAITRGRGTAIVVATGMRTEIGKIAGMLQEGEREPTPLQGRLAQVGKTVLKGSVAISGLLVVAGVLRGGSLFEMFMTGVSLAVAAIPEGLPAVVTLALAAGVSKMARSNAVVRRLPAVETLGCATVICTDKTGTLTKNEQTVRTVYCPDEQWQFTGAGYDPEDGKVIKDGKTSEAEKALISTLTAAVLCSNAELVQWQEAGRMSWTVRGDPTEGAILVAARKGGLSLSELKHNFKRLKEVPFDAERRCMTVVCAEEKGKELVFVKGDPDTILERCTRIQVHEQVLPLDEAARDKILAVNEQLTEKAMRVLGVAYRPPCERYEDDCLEQELIFLGLIGMLDPPRKEVREAISRSRKAGIRVVMITGDHRNTALAVGRELALIEENGQVLTGSELDRLSDQELARTLGEVQVFARVLPKHKLRLVKAFRSRGEVVAMIGDGVNDAPAVKEADIGIAMGKTGTDVTKQSAEIVITDDNFASVVTAVGQGRGIYENIRRSVRYLLATNIGEVLLMFGAVLVGMPLPLVPIQLLWLNLLGDGLPALALGVDPPDPGLMNQPPRPKDCSLFDGGLKGKILSRGLAIGLTGLGAFWWGLRSGNLCRAQTMVLALLTGSQLLHALDCRQDEQSAEKMPCNKQLHKAVTISAALLLGAVYLPPLQRTLKTCPLGINELAGVGLGVGLTAGLDHMIYGLLPKKEEVLLLSTGNTSNEEMTS